MRSNTWTLFGMQKEQFASYACLFLVCMGLLGCASTKQLNGKTTIQEAANTSQPSGGSNGTIPSPSAEIFDLDDHLGIWMEQEVAVPPASDSSFSLIPTVEILGEGTMSSRDIVRKELEMADDSSPKSAVADKIVENYLNSDNKAPGGHCLDVSKTRFIKAYEEVYGRSVYEDLPDSIATPYYTPREVFEFLYNSASGVHEGWRSLPIEYRGKGNAGAIASAGMGTLVDGYGIWHGKLRPGALMQVWKHRKDYQDVVKGVNKKDFDPFGHSFIFMGYVRDEDHNIIGIRIADQGYQGYRPLLPDDYEVWWAVNLSI
jgi:hypothetical protein